ncbi:di-heme-cytochrome C peroxidase [Roseomonas sp. AR75]|uniref:di-heme-cytochrome C peroxidase n=1 Tax=Roseomonas sp. AR75 TaxID=2562311 RepID=UPI0010C09CD1|nr:di-heme-cytochrome C peroxidase [Roseomonas sp. AR75]
MRATMFGIAGALALAGCAALPPEPGPPPPAGWQSVDQGPEWRIEDRAAFYTQDQGSEIMPAAWMAALRQPDGQPFLADRLTRYGYLVNDTNPTASLPVGFTLAGPPGRQVVGMTCAACHTREIEIQGRPYRIDGGPALADFERFLLDLRAAVARVQDDHLVFEAFATEVLGAGADLRGKEALRRELDVWWRRYATIIDRSLPNERMWGPGRLDAISMIFNRVAGLDIGAGPDRIIESNMAPADAPTRYPFLWNASRQDQTQWPGFAENGNDVLALIRNLGQVYGVFASFHPVPDRRVPIFRVNYVAQNSANFAGLGRLEELIQRIGPPRAPFIRRTPQSDALAVQGRAIFARDPAQGGCAVCHDPQPGAFRSLTRESWLTTIRDVGTDSREIGLLGRQVQTGVLAGKGIPGFGTLGTTDKAVSVLALTVIGAIVQYPFTGRLDQMSPDRLISLPGEAGAAAAVVTTRRLRQAIRTELPTGAPYESRVLQGIWAAAPYLHNGSVPTLADLLEPAANRPAAFEVGTAYDPVLVGLAREQPRSRGRIVTTDCSDRNSGNSRCGHEYGTGLSIVEKQALLEYLRRL